MAEFDNPVGRIYNLLKIAKSRPPNTPGRQVWEEILPTFPRNDFELIAEFAAFKGLIDDARYSISRLDNIDKSLFESYLKIVEVALGKAMTGQSIETAINSVLQEVDAGVMTGLHFMSSAVAMAGLNDVVIDIDLGELLQDIESLLAEVLESNIDQGLKTHIVEGLEVVRRSIVNYQLFGADGLRRSLDIALGTFLRYKDELYEAQQSGNRDFISRLATTLQKLDRITSLALKVKQLPWPDMEFLKLGSGN